MYVYISTISQLLCRHDRFYYATYIFSEPFASMLYTIRKLETQAKAYIHPLQRCCLFIGKVQLKNWGSTLIEAVGRGMG